MSKGGNANNVNEALGALYLSQGQYSQAAQTLKGTNSNTQALAEILNKDYTSAAAS